MQRKESLFEKITTLVLSGDVKISEHGYDEMAEDDLTVRELVAGVRDGIIIEEYDDFPKGPCVLVLQKDRNTMPVHTVWGIPKGYTSPAVLVTAYRPDPARWSEDFQRRIQS